MNKQRTFHQEALATWPIFEYKLRVQKRRVRLRRAATWLLALAVVLTLVYYWSGQPVVKKKATVIKNAPKALQKKTNLSTHAAVQFMPFTPLPIPPSINSSRSPRFVNLAALAYKAPITQLDFTQQNTLLPKNTADLWVVFLATGLDADQVVWSSNHQSLSAYLPSNQLLVMQLRGGTNVLPTQIDLSSATGSFRPSDFPIDLFVHYALYDIRPFIQVPPAPRLVSHAVTPPVRMNPKFTSSESYTIYGASPNLRTGVIIPTSSAYGQKYDQSVRSHLVYSSQQMESRRYRLQPTQHAVQTMQPVLLSNKLEPNLFYSADTICILLNNATSLLKLSTDGLFYSQKTLEITGRNMQSVKKKRLLFDATQQELYLLCSTNFHFVLYRLEAQSGQLKEVFQSQSIWPDPDFSIENSTLFYTYHAKSYREELP
ncbi:MAG: hypothetical protein RLZZ301_1095 [Bacteroidota bacterium]|jgi:hypothetical protein